MAEQTVVERSSEDELARWSSLGDWASRPDHEESWVKPQAMVDVEPAPRRTVLIRAQPGLRRRFSGWVRRTETSVGQASMACFRWLLGR